MAGRQAAPAQALPPRDVSAAIRELLRVKSSHQPAAVRKVAETPRKGYMIHKLEFVSEPGIYIPMWIFAADQTRRDKRPILFINDNGKEADGMEFGLYERLALAGRLVASADVRGIGQTKPP